MSETLPKLHGAWRRLRRTPFGDLVRGRLSGRLDWRLNVQSGGLARPAGQLIVDVVRRTKLWQAEKVAVAEELIAHFADGAERGAAAEALVASFGDPKRAAKLITRAKRRARAWPARLLARCSKGVVSSLVVYAALAIPYVIGRPTPSVDYVAVLNRPILGVPTEQRGWPLYRKAILALAERPASLGTDRWPPLLGEEPGGKRWPEMAAWLRQHAEGVELVRQAAQKPTFGFVLGWNGSDSADAALGWDFSSRSDDNTTVGPPLTHVLLPYLSDVRVLADVLSFDAKLAREERDAARWERDVNALLGMSAQQAHETQFFLTALFAVGYRGLAQLQIDSALAGSPELLDDATLTRLAHRLSGPRVPGDLVGLEGERLFTLDAIQRVYTDDGHGDGRLTLRGMITFAELDGEAHADSFARNPFAGPIVQLVAISRRKLAEEHDRFMDQIEASLQLPQRDAQLGIGLAEKARINSTGFARTRYAVWNAMLPTFTQLGATPERSLGHTDGLLIGIALELYKRRHGEHPPTLDALTPELLPSVPVDRITGGPLHYKLVAGKPLVYSVGADRIDDGGKTVDVQNPQSAAQWGVKGVKVQRGDWVIYPWNSGINANE